MQLDHIMQQSAAAFSQYKETSLAQRATFLRHLAELLDQEVERLLPIACAESHLPEGRIKGELARTTGQIRLFATYLEEGSWLEVTIDHGDPDRSPAPKPDLRRMLVPLGPVIVFGASNFPLAFSTAGGDSISALAAGCTVVYKGHPAHPETSLLVCELVQAALKEQDLPAAIFQHVAGGIAEGQELVQHPLAEAVAFTGSYTGGKALFDLAYARPKPIPVYAEMGSTNPIVALEEYCEANMEKMASDYSQSLTLGAGQFCTNPGLLFIPESKADDFAALAAKLLAAMPSQLMLHPGIQSAYASAVEAMKAQAGLEWVYTPDHLTAALPALARVKMEDWSASQRLHEEVFGPFGLMVTYADREQLHAMPALLQGQLTITLWAEEQELAAHEGLIAGLGSRCGRLLFGGVPTGVEVGHAMQHGGPFPATTDSRSTSVGVHAIKRFARPLAYQNCPDSLLPEALKEKNPLKISRTVDGKLSLGD